jgi:ribonucleoside-diphosphate reductase alpha chain
MDEYDYFDTQLGIDIWNNKYRYNNESFEEWLVRVSGGDQSCMQLIKNKKFMFGGRILANRGLTGRNVSYSNCFYMDIPDDSIDAIYQTNSDLAKTFSWGGGVGIDCSTLAPRGAKINNAAKETTGAVSFMETFNQTGGTIGAEGRRAALLLSLKSEHPDLPEFIELKTKKDVIKYANISVQISDSFMEAVVDGSDEYMLSFTRYNGETFSKGIDPVKVFHRIAENNYNWSEPGLQFIDKMKNYNHMFGYDEFKIGGTNACSELSLPDGGACLLGSHNLSAYINRNGKFDFDEFSRCVELSVLYMNEVLQDSIDNKRYPLERQLEVAKRWRQLGIGVMGFADMLMRLDIPYESDEAIYLAREIVISMQIAALKGSMECAELYGTFDGYDKLKTLESPILRRLHCLDDITDDFFESNGLCNASLLSIAPTGSISTMLNISGGIEPYYALSYNRKTESLHGEDKYYQVYIDPVKELLDSGELDALPVDDPVFATSKQINPYQRIAMQSVWQEYVDTSISSTINLPNDYPLSNICDLIIEAWQYDLKGITFHREGSFREGILTEGNLEVEDVINRGEWKPLSDDISYYKRKLYTGCGKITMFIGYSHVNDRIEEFWIKRSGQGGCEKSLDNISIAMSGMLRLGGDIHNIEKAFDGVGTCPAFTNARRKGNRISPGKNCGDAMLKELIKFKQDVSELSISSLSTDDLEDPYINTLVTCPKCGEPLQFSGGCIECHNCGYTRCE